MLVLVILTLQQSLPLVPMLRPTITMAEYRELEVMKAYVQPGSFVISKMPLGYWAEYVLDGKRLKPGGKPWGLEVYIVERVKAPIPLKPNFRLLYEGNFLKLIKALPPRRR